ncbi:MAG: TlpA family protein disulfide reductase [Saprospiraceae bacterium]
MIEKIKSYWNKKTKWSKISDLIFIVFIIALLFPQGRLAIGGGVNRIKALLVQPSISDSRVKIQENELNWELTSTTGESLNLTDSKKTVKFINLWATWCPPCVGEMPEIEILYKKFEHNENVEFYMISDEKIDKIKSFISKHEYNFPVFKSESAMPAAFETQGIPPLLYYRKIMK